MSDYISQLLKSIQDEDREKEMFLMKDKTPYQTRDTYSKALGKHTMDNYDIKTPENTKSMFADSSKLDDAVYSSVTPDKLGENQALYLPKTKKILTNANKPLIETIPDALHEGQHHIDFKDESKAAKYLNEAGYDADKVASAIPKGNYNKMTGLSNAEKFFEGHHATDSMFERDGLKRLMKNGKLAVGGLAPLLKAAAIGTLGYQALGIGQKAMAGDLGGAGLDTADLATDYVPVVGQAKMALRPSELGNGELPPEEMTEQIKFNQIQKRLQGK